MSSGHEAIHCSTRRCARCRLVADQCDAVEPFTALGRNAARPMAGSAKLIAGFTGECCECAGFGDEVDDVGDDADEQDVTVSVDPLSS